MRSYRERQIDHIAGLNRVRDDMPDIVWVTQERGRWKRVGEITQEAPCLVTLQNISCYVPLSPSSALARFRKHINNGARVGILTALFLVFMSTDGAAIHILILAAVFCVLGLIAGALIYVLLSIVVSLLKIGLLLVAAVVVSGLVMRGCTHDRESCDGKNERYANWFEAADWSWQAADEASLATVMECAAINRAARSQGDDPKA